MPFLALAASAGRGAIVAEEREARGVAFARATLRSLGIAPADASVISVAGESMAPTLLDGDRVLVDRADRVPRSSGGVYVLREDDALSVKRLFARPGGWRVVSDNPAFAERRVDGDALIVVGRARLLVREV